MMSLHTRQKSQLPAQPERSRRCPKDGGRRRGFREWTPPEVKKRTQQVPAVNSQKEGYAASSRGSRELKKENLTAPEPIATDLETAKETESESDYIVIIMMCPIHGSVQ